MNELTYTMVGDYNLPNLTMPNQPEVSLGIYAQMRKKFLKEHHKVLYYNLLTTGELISHLAETEQRANEMEQTLLKQMAKKEGLTEQMKATDMMNWVRLMNNLRNSVREIVISQVIYA
ncbi:MAG: TnpV protein [Clostridiales bacterium]|nr:TnpV protein [Clostridiales bacterium]